MNLKWFHQALRRYGAAVSALHGGESRTLRGFIQPLTGERELPQTGSELGLAEERLWRWLGEGPLEVGDAVVWQETVFFVRAAEPIYLGGTLTHWWAALELSQEAEEA